MLSLDSSVVISALEADDANHARALAALLAHQATGLVLSPPVYSELRAGGDWPKYGRWLRMTRTRVVWEMPEAVWELAGERQGLYAQQRRSGQLPRRTLPDFLIAAHAEHHALDVMSFDRTVYDSVFTGLTLIDPAQK